MLYFFFFQSDGVIREAQESRWVGDVFKGQSFDQDQAFGVAPRGERRLHPGRCRSQLPQRQRGPDGRDLSPPHERSGVKGQLQSPIHI